MRGLWIVWLACLGCRDAQEPVPFEDCQPYPLECSTCTIEQDLDGQIERIYQCETGDGSLYDAVQRPGIDQPTTDTHFYDPDSGARLAASREYAEPIDVCGKSRDTEWYGEVLHDCLAVCELDASMNEADDQLPEC